MPNELLNDWRLMIWGSYKIWAKSLKCLDLMVNTQPATWKAHFDIIAKNEQWNIPQKNIFYLISWICLQSTISMNKFWNSQYVSEMGNKLGCNSNFQKPMVLKKVHSAKIKSWQPSTSPAICLKHLKSTLEKVIKEKFCLNKSLKPIS